MTVYKVIDLRTRQIVKETSSRVLAYRYAHKKDAEYGAVRYVVIFEVQGESFGEPESQNERVKF